MSLKIEGLSLRQGDFELGPLELELKPGERLLVAGPSGSGKTTLLRAVAGLAIPQAGRIALGETLFHGNGVSLPPERRRVGMVFQDLALWPHLSAREHLAFVLRHQDLSRKDAAALAEEGLRRFRLADKAERKPGELSGGETQRLALARALVFKPWILLLDEPLGQLDPHLRGEAAAFIEQVHGEIKIPILHVTHDLLDLAIWKGRIVLLRAGRIEQLGSLQEFLDTPRTPFVRQFLNPLLDLRRALHFPDRSETRS